MDAHIRGWISALALVFAAGRALAVEPDPCIPPDTIFAMKIRPRQILTSALVKDLGWDELFKTTLAAVGPVQEFLETAGLRIDRDLESILWCMPSSPFVDDPDDDPDAPPKAIDPETGEIIQLQPAGEKPSSNWLVVVRGKFSPKKITQALENHGKSAGAPIKKLKVEGSPFLQMQSPLGPIFLSFDGKNKVIVSNQLERLKSCLGGGYDKPPSELFLNGMKGLTDQESLWIVQPVNKDLKKQLEQEAKELDQEALKEIQSFQFCMTLSDGIQGKLTIATTASQHASSIKALLTPKMKEIEEHLAKVFNDPKEHIPEDGIEKLGGSVEAGILYLAIKQGKLDLEGNEMVLKVSANRKSLEPFLKALELSGK